MSRYSVGWISTRDETFINNVQSAPYDVAAQVEFCQFSVSDGRFVCRIFVQQLAWLSGVEGSISLCPASPQDLNGPAAELPTNSPETNEKAIQAYSLF